MQYAKLVRVLPIFLSLAFILTLNSAFGATANLQSPVGYWRTIDDQTHQPSSVVQITESNNKLYGRIVKIYPKNGNKSDSICSKCPGDLHNKPVLGMTFMWDLVKDNDGWGKGKIMDPKTGKIYKCQIHLTDNGTKLQVRGFIGISLIGRTQTWERLENYKAKI